MDIPELSDGGISTNRRTRNGEDCQLQKDKSNQPESKWSSKESESQPLSPTAQADLFKYPDVETDVYDTVAGSSYFKGRSVKNTSPLSLTEKI